MLDETVRQFLRTRVALFAVPFLMAACGLAILIEYAPWRQSFDAVLWNEEDIPASERLEMADDLVARRLFDGMTRSEVVALLGEPPPTEYFRDWDLVYWLGPERGYISIDSEWLVVRFGEVGRVSEYRIVRDQVEMASPRGGQKGKTNPHESTLIRQTPLAAISVD